MTLDVSSLVYVTHVRCERCGIVHNVEKTHTCPRCEVLTAPRDHDEDWRPRGDQGGDD